MPVYIYIDGKAQPYPPNAPMPNPGWKVAFGEDSYTVESVVVDLSMGMVNIEVVKD